VIYYCYIGEIMKKNIINSFSIIMILVLFMAFISCDNSGLSLTVGPCTSHTWTAWEITAVPTCIATGTGSRYCIKCGIMDPNTTVPVNLNTHAFVAWTAMAAHTSCIQKLDCSLCGYYESRHVEAGCTGTSGLSFQENTYEGGYEVDYNNREKDFAHICVPNTYNGKPVIGIGSDAFFGNRNIQSIRAGANLTYIRSSAFENCTALRSISFPAADTFNDSAFFGCALESVSFPVATNISINVFRNCTSLKSVSLPAAIIICESAFDGCTSLARVTLGTVDIYFAGDAFPGNLVSVHKNGGNIPGTYVRTPPAVTWTREP